LVVLVLALARFGGLSLFGLFQSPSPPPKFELVFSSVSIDAGRNASWVVDSVDGGPYASTGFSMRLSVNGTSTNWVRLSPSQTVQSVVVGTVTYRFEWRDSDGNGTVSKGDRFSVSGDKAPIPARSTFEFALKWSESWLSHAYWSTG
jgi:hypothetical protein